MASKVLLAVDESRNSLKAIRYVAENLQCDSQVTLISIVPDAAAACELDGPSLVPIFKENRQAFCTLEDKKRESIKDFMGQAKVELVKAGFSSKDVAVKVRKKRKGIARDIMEEAKKGRYDTLVIGRRGLTGVKEFLMGSVSNKLLHLTSNMTIIVVD